MKTWRKHGLKTLGLCLLLSSHVAYAESQSSGSHVKLFLWIGIGVMVVMDFLYETKWKKERAARREQERLQAARSTVQHKGAKKRKKGERKHS